jgi:hypothetical protein
MDKLNSIAITLRQMSDNELITSGKQVRKLAEPRIIPVADPWKVQLDEARAEWRRRHPRRAQTASLPFIP